MQSDAADVEILFEAVGLEEVGQLECAHVAALVADFALEVAQHLGEIFDRKSGAEEFIPEPLPVKTQREVLTGPPAIELVALLDLSVAGR